MYFKPIKLRVNYGKSDQNTVVDAPSPILTWGALHEEVEETQEAYWIRAFDGEQLLWDSGWVQSSVMQAVYAGERLTPESRVTWEVKLEDGHGRFSETAQGFFRVAPESFPNAKWITTAEDEIGRAKYFAKQFPLRKPLKRATLYAAGIGFQQIFINGILADSAVLSPMISNYQRNCYCVMLEVEKLLQEGGNCLGIVVGEGWRRNDGPYLEGVQGRQVDFFGTPQLFARVVLEFQDGSRQVLETDDTWYGFSGGTVRNHLFDGETFDRRLEPKGWNLPDFDLSPFQQAVYAESLPRLSVQKADPVRVQKRCRPVSVLMLKAGQYRLDFGENLAGFVELTIPQGTPAGTKIRLFHAEEISGDGALSDAQRRGAQAVDEYISDGEDGGTTWHPGFVYHGFRYVVLEGWPGIPDEYSAVALFIHSDVDNASSFRCGSAIVNQIQQNILCTERANLQGIATDCPQRDERMGWMNDATVRFEETPYNFEMGWLFPKIIKDLVVEQDENGAIPCTAPYVYGYRPADPVCSSFLVAGMQAYLHYGNVKLLKEHYHAFRAWNECLKMNSRNGIVEYSHYGDWAGPADCCLSEENALSAITPGILMSTGYHYYNYRMLEKIAVILGNAQEAEQNAAEAERVQKAFLEKWWQPESGIVGTGSQGCQAFALWLGILPEDGRSKAAAVMQAAVVHAGHRFTTGNLTSRYLMDMLADYGFIEDAWKIITREEYPSFGYMIQNGATTIWERFEQKENNGMNSHSHPMYGAVGEWFYSRIAGLIPTHGGWSRFLVQPCVPKDLLSAEATVDTVKGQVGIRWIKQYGILHLNIQVPFGAEAELRFGGESKMLGSGYHTFHYSLETLL